MIHIRHLAPLDEMFIERRKDLSLVKLAVGSQIDSLLLASFLEGGDKSFSGSVRVITYTM